ncbi:MAG: sodium ion-translocating decarboxylase subunit beta [Bacilli bacterium]|nr:sodium ion-translocating decarboxylase subunit beta [Bacilli bacterium]
MEKFWETIKAFFESSGIAGFFTIDGGWRYLVMIIIALVLLFLAIKKKFEPYLLLPIAFGMLLVNLPFGGAEIFSKNADGEYTGIFGFLYYGVKWGIYPCLIFLCIGATTDFGPLIANKKTMLLGAAAQLGIFITFIGAIVLGKNVLGWTQFDAKIASAIGIIGGADGPTAILVTSKLAPEYLSSIAIVAYSYMALVPVIQPPIIRLLTTKKERQIKMETPREVSKTEKILFPIIVTIVTVLIVPSAAPLIGCLMLGNLIKESGVVPQITETLAKTLMYIVTILLGVCVGCTADATTFLTLDTILIFVLGIIAFSFATACGILGGKLMCLATRGKVNPMIGAAGVSAVPMAARVVHKEGLKEDPTNFLLMHAMGPNVAGVIGSAVAAGVLLLLFL